MPGDKQGSRIPRGMPSEPKGHGPTAFQIDSFLEDRWAEHGTEKHKGFRCCTCADASPRPVRVHSLASREARYQAELLAWNEDNDQKVQGHLISCPGGQPLDQCSAGHWPLLPRPERDPERIHL